MAILLVLIAPAFTCIKGGTDVTNAAYTIKGVLETARTYAKANNTYTWVGFYEGMALTPRHRTQIHRRRQVVISIVASKDGTNLGADPVRAPPVSENWIDATRLAQIGKLVRIDNLHFPLFAMCTSNCGGDTFDTRPVLQLILSSAITLLDLENSGPGSEHCSYDTTNSGLTKFPFQYPVGNPAPRRNQFRRTYGLAQPVTAGSTAHTMSVR